MLAFLYGSDAYRLRQAKEEIISRYKTKHSSGMNLFSVDLSEPAGIETFESALKSSSFFNEHKLVVCKNIFNKKGAELLAKYITEYELAKATDITLIATENMTAKELAVKNKNLFKILSDKKNLVQEIEPLQGAGLLEWVKKELKSRDCSIELSAARNLINIVGTDSWGIINEIDKLTAYKTGEITTGDITNLITAKTDLSIFDLIDALGSKDRRRGLELLYKELGTGRDPYYILTMMTYQFRNMLTITDLKERGLPESEIVKKTKLHPFVIKKILNNSGRFSSEEIRKIYGYINTLDKGFKKGDMNLEDYLYKLVLL